jgi:AcrR family transcriptional regulator
MNSKVEAYRNAIMTAKRSAILQAARTRFLKHGYTHTGMTDIANDADVSTATLYKHFRSKEILFAEIVEETSNNFRFEFTPPDDNNSLFESFCNAADSALKSYLESDLQALMRIVIAEVPYAPELARGTFRRITEHWYRETITVLNELIAQGLMKPHDSELSARFLIGMMREVFIWEGLFQTAYVTPSDEDGKKIREIIGLFLDRYCVHPPETHHPLNLQH